MPALDGTVPVPNLPFLLFEPEIVDAAEDREALEPPELDTSLLKKSIPIGAEPRRELSRDEWLSKCRDVPRLG